jgi:hypothetical protein
MPRKGAKTKVNHGSHKRTLRGTWQDGTGVSHRDAVAQNRKFIIYDTLPIDNATSDFAYGLKAFNVRGNSSPFQNLIGFYSRFYEQYRVRSIFARAQVGKGFTNDDRIKSYCVGRVDVDQQISASTLPNVQALLNAENSVYKTFTEKGNVAIGDWPPICRSSISNLSEPFLPNRNQWYSTNDAIYHTWKGLILAVLFPEPNLQPNTKNLTITLELDLEFRGRITDSSAFANSNSITQTNERVGMQRFIPVEIAQEVSDSTRIRVPDDALDDSTANENPTDRNID